MKNDPPMLGKYVKLIKSGEIVELKSYDPRSQACEVELRTGAVSTVRRHEIDVITADEEMDFLRSRAKGSN